MVRSTMSLFFICLHQNCFRVRISDTLIFFNSWKLRNPCHNILQKKYIFVIQVSKELEECVIYAALKLKIFQIWDPLKGDKKIASSNTLCCGTHFLILESCEIARGLLYLQKNSWKSKYFKIYNAKGQQISTFW